MSSSRTDQPGRPDDAPRAELQTLLDALPAWRVVCDADGRVVECHWPEEHGLDCPATGLRGRSVAEILPAPCGELLAGAVRRSRTMGECTTVVLDLDQRGEKRTYEAHIVPLLDGRVGVVGLDVSSRAATLEALQRSEERFRLAFKTSPDSIAINRATDGEYVATNEGFSELVGWREDEAIGRTSVELGLWSDPREREAMLAALRRDGKARIEGHFRRRNGEIGIGILSAVLFDLDGVPHILSVTRDVTQEREKEKERLRLEQALRQSQKLEALGRLAGGIAHDFNNLLMGILGYSDMLERSIRKGSPRGQDVDQIRRAAERARDLTAQLLAFARKQPVAPQAVSLNDAIRGSEKLLRRLLGEDVELIVDLAPGLWPVKADTSQLDQVLLNLVVNGRDAMPGGGTLSIGTANVDLGMDPSAARAGAADGSCVMLSVADSGVGLSADAQAHLFEPFFTTKTTGTGLGLATVYGIVRQHGGHITVSSERDRGTTFRVYLPRTTEPVTEDADASEALPEAPGGSETVLLVEDDTTVRELVELTLREAGYRVIAARDGQEALHLAEAAGEPIHVLLTDLVLPWMSGPELAAQLLARRPGLRVIYMSGYHRETTADLPGPPGSRAQLLAKPFTAAQLQRKIREVL